MWPGWVQGDSDGPLVPMVRLVPMENDAIPMVLLVQNKFAFTPSRNALIIIMNIPRSISQPRKTSSLLHPVKVFLKCLRNIHMSNIFDYVSFRSFTKPLRNVDHLTLDVPFSRTDVFKNSCFVRICRLWNEFPLSIRKSNTLSIFRKNLMASFYDKFDVNFP